MELSPDGAGYRLNTRFARFINVPELMQMFRQSADVQTAAMLNLPRPKLDGENLRRSHEDAEMFTTRLLLNAQLKNAVSGLHLFG